MAPDHHAALHFLGFHLFTSCVYIHVSTCILAVTCTPACQNGGTCRGNSSYTYCDCPKNYTGQHCENRGTATHNQTVGGPGNMQMVVLYLQTVVPPVGMEEHAIVHLPALTVTVPVGTQETTARVKVFIHTASGASPCKHP